MTAKSNTQAAPSIQQAAQQALDALTAFDGGANRHGHTWQRSIIAQLQTALAAQPTPEPVAHSVTDAMVDAGLKAACFHSTTESRKDMRNALQAALESAAPSPVALQGRDDDEVRRIDLPPAVVDQLAAPFNLHHWTPDFQDRLYRFSQAAMEETLARVGYAEIERWYPGRASLPAGGVVEPVAALIRSRALMTPAKNAHDGQDHFTYWSEWQPATVAHAMAVTDPRRNTPAIWQKRLLVDATPQPSETQGRSYGAGKFDEKSMTECLEQLEAFNEMAAAYEGHVGPIGRILARLRISLGLPPDRPTLSGRDAQPSRKVSQELRRDLIKKWFAKGWSVEHAFGLLDDYEALLSVATQHPATQGRRQMTDGEAGRAFRDCRDRLKLPRLDYQSFSLGRECAERFHGIPASPQDGGAA